MNFPKLKISKQKTFIYLYRFLSLEGGETYLNNFINEVVFGMLAMGAVLERIDISQLSK